MLSRSLKLTLILAALSPVGTTLAAPDCTSEPQSRWLSEAAMKDKIRKLGYKIKLFKVAGSCYEIYGWNKEGEKAEVYFNPVTAEIVKSEIG